MAKSGKVLPMPATYEDAIDNAPESRNFFPKDEVPEEFFEGGDFNEDGEIILLPFSPDTYWEMMAEHLRGRS